MGDRQIKPTTARTLRRKNVLLLAFTAMSGVMYSSAFAQTAETATHTTRKPHVRTTKSAKAVKATPVTAAPAAAAPAVVAPVVAPASRNASVLSAAAAAPEAPSQAESIMVTGSLFRDPNTTSASPITHITAKDLQQRGIKTVTDALQLLSSNGAGNLTNAWSAGGGFAAGASAPSLRGLSTDSTLVLMDGQRLSYYPLADDGERNFVDTNWMPQSIMQSVDVMQDGGSATYGADAVAGVVNMITRKEIQGFEGNAEGGLTQRGDAGHQRLYATYGHGDLARDGYNFYVNSEYQQDDPLYYRQLGYPYKSGDLTGIGGTNGNDNIQSGSSIANFTPSTVAIARPVDGSGTATGPWQLLNQSAGCNSLGGIVATGTVSGTPGVSQACTMNSQKFAQVAPDLRRVSATAHFTANVTERSQLVAMFTWSQARSIITGTPYGTYGGSSYTQADLATAQNTYEPVYLANGSLNPNNPYAAQGEEAQIASRFSDLLPTTTETSQNFRGSVRYSGWAPSNWGSDWNYDVNFVGMNTLLNQTITGVPTINGIENAISSGSYNFVDPSQNSQAVLNSIAPRNVMNARTQEYSGEMSASKGLFRLPGGMAKLAIGGNIRYEALNDPNANPLNPDDPGAQYTSYINPVNARGSRWVESGFFEVNLPFVKMLNVDVSGRYDNYSEGFSHFSPKVGVQFKPVDKFTLRGTFSNGFRVPSFAETGGSNIGYTPYTPTNAAFINQHLNADGTKDNYAQNYYLGVNTSGNPDLKPETSVNFSGGPIFRPTKWLTLSADYYYIRKNHYIAPNPVQYDVVAEDYLSGAALPAGVTVTPSPADPLHPNAQPSPGIINLGYVNTNKLVTDGFDLSIEINTQLPGFLHEVHWYSKGNATFVDKMNLTNPDGSVYRYAGTLGPYLAVSASGTPKWRANWSNTFSWKKLSVTPTVYYTSGYKTTAEDYTGSGTANNCADAQLSSSFVPTGQCKVKGWWDVDLTVNYQISPRWGVYANVYNLLGFRAPYDFGTYGGYLYNSSWSQNGVVMRSFQFGVNVKL
ncbi:TonB-dependent receptor [Gluconacetobacter takamatsuzukensis]|uniref:TonB-dependent receptor n=2 Tax=Gluconacetobacter takamatsuzukensis TaxID=1286190 RepID=A0A7W4KGD7_9PROT|nr:TonB-dependent receptor [Gluconacetobacter takamatsuzukensis]